MQRSDGEGMASSVNSAKNENLLRLLAVPFFAYRSFSQSRSALGRLVISTAPTPRRAAFQCSK
jgi:hypothetical protein